MYNIFEGAFFMQVKKQSSLKRLFVPVIVLCSLLLSGNAADAAQVIYSFTGIVDDVHPQLESTFSEGQSLSGSMTVNMADSNINPRVGHYTVTNFSLSVGGYTATMGPSGQVQIQDKLTGFDRMDGLVSTPNGLSVDGLSLKQFDFGLRGPASLFNSDALPMTPPSLSSFTRNQFRLSFGEGLGRSVSGVLTSLTAVPLPAAVILFGAGLVALVGLGAGGLRNLRRPHQA
jgi:hypothetical protein